MSDNVCSRCGKPKAGHTPNANDPAWCPGYLYVDKTGDALDDKEVHDDLTTVALIDATQAAVLMIDRLRGEASKNFIETDPQGVVKWEGHDNIGSRAEDDPALYMVYVARCAKCGLLPEVVFDPKYGKVTFRCDRCGILIMDPKVLPK